MPNVSRREAFPKTLKAGSLTSTCYRLPAFASRWQGEKQGKAGLLNPCDSQEEPAAAFWCNQRRGSSVNAETTGKWHFLDLLNAEKLQVITVAHTSTNQSIKWLPKQARVSYCSLHYNWSCMLLIFPHTQLRAQRYSAPARTQGVSKRRRSKP